MLDKSGDKEFEENGLCTYNEGQCITPSDKNQAIERADKYFNPKRAKRAGEHAESARPGSSTPLPTRSYRPLKSAEQAKQDSAEPEILRGEQPDDTEEEPTSAARIGSEQDGAGPQKLPAKRMSREQRNLAAFNGLSADEKRPLGLRGSRR
jgi:hypothetical protein